MRAYRWPRPADAIGRTIDTRHNAGMKDGLIEGGVDNLPDHLTMSKLRVDGDISCRIDFRGWNVGLCEHRVEGVGLVTA
jgi:hypothetical protein